MSRSKMTQAELFDRLRELFLEEHGECGDATCGMSVAECLGYHHVALEDFASCGGASEQFYALYEQLGKGFFRAARAERKAFARTPGVDCPHCNAFNYSAAQDHNCDDCGKRMDWTAEQIARERASRQLEREAALRKRELLDNSTPEERRARFRLIWGGAA